MRAHAECWERKYKNGTKAANINRGVNLIAGVLTTSLYTPHQQSIIVLTLQIHVYVNTIAHFTIRYTDDMWFLLM